MTLLPSKKEKINISKKPNLGKIFHQATNFLNKIKDPQSETLRQESVPTTEQGITVSVPKEVAFFLGQKNDLFIQGTRGTLVHRFGKNIQLHLGLRSLTVVFEKKQTTSFLRTQKSLLYSMFVGVTKGYKEKIKTAGVGYRVNIEGTQLLTLSLGYSHQIQRCLHPTIEARFNKKNNRINFLAPSLPLLTESVAGLHRLKKPDVYNGKGVRYRGLKLRKKEGKKQGR